MNDLKKAIEQARLDLLEKLADIPPGHTLIPTEKTEYVWEEADNGGGWTGWTITNKTELSLFIAAFGTRCRLNRLLFENAGRGFSGRGTARKIFKPVPDPQAKLWIAPVWLTDKEKEEEKDRLAALRLLGG